MNKRILLMLVLLFSMAVTMAQQGNVVVISKQQKQAEKLYNKAYEKYTIKSYQGAIADLQEALKIKPDLLDVYPLLAACEQALKKGDEAVKTLLTYADKLTQKDSAYRLIAHVYYENENYPKVIEYADKSLQIASNDFQTAYLRGLAAYQTGDYQRAITDFSTALNLKKDAWCYNDRAAAYMQTDAYDKAIEDYTAAVELNTKSDLFYNNRGNAYLKLGDLGKAEADFTQAITLNPQEYQMVHNKKGQYHNNRGLVYFQLESYQKALEDFDKSIELSKEADYQVFSNRGAVYYKLKRYQDAINDFDKALELNPQFGEGYMHRGNAKEMLRKPTEACEDWTKAFDMGVEKAKEYVNNQCK